MKIVRIIAAVVLLCSLSACESLGQLLYDGQVNKAVEDCNKYVSGQDMMSCRAKVRANAGQTPIGTKDPR
jgi:hypothetical protein